MSFFPGLARRRRQPEVMDQPGLDAHRHHHALRSLERINWLSHSAGILWPSIRALAAEMQRPLRLLDVATGAGDVPVRLWQRARRAGLALEVEGCDVSPVALAHAGRRAEAARAGVGFFAWDVLRDPPPDDYDVVTCSLFLHHLDDDEAVALLRRLAGAARRLILVNDLERSRLGYLLAYVGARILTRSDVVHTDGPLSVEGAFTPAEARELARRADLAGAQVARRWPCRFLLTWKRP